MASFKGGWRYRWFCQREWIKLKHEFNSPTLLPLFPLNTQTQKHTTLTHPLITCIGVSAGISAVHHFLMWRTQAFLISLIRRVCVSVRVGHFVCVMASVCICGRACGDSLMCDVDERRVYCGGWVCVCVRGQDPRAGSLGWVEVTGATVRCRLRGYRTQSVLQTLELGRGRTGSWWVSRGKKEKFTKYGNKYTKQSEEQKNAKNWTIG